MNPAHINTSCFIGQADSEKMLGACRTVRVWKTNKRRRWFKTSEREGTKHLSPGAEINGLEYSHRYGCLCTGHEGIFGSGGIPPLILNFGNRVEWVFFFMLRSLYYREKCPWYPLNQWRTEGEFGGGSTPPPKFWNFYKAETNSQLRGKYIRNCLVFLFHHPN
jgi:hypothetical protein